MRGEGPARDHDVRGHPSEPSPRVTAQGNVLLDAVIHLAQKVR